MDELHVLLIGAIIANGVKLRLLEKIFSLPGDVIEKELMELARYGFVEHSSHEWGLTHRGKTLAKVWKAFGNKESVVCQSDSRRWRLGTGTFSADEALRDYAELEFLMSQFGIAEKCITLVTTGELSQLNELLEEIPSTVLDILRVPGMGPKKAAILCRELQIENLEQLQAACEAGRVQELKGFGPKSQETILGGIAIAQAATQRDASAIRFLDERRKAAEQFEAFLLSWPPKNDSPQSVFTEQPVMDAVELAECDETLNRLEKTFRSHVSTIVKQEKERRTVPVEANGENATNDSSSIEYQVEQAIEQFNKTRKHKKYRNLQTARIKSVCETSLSRRWLLGVSEGLAAVFDDEPSAFVFQSTVPIFVEQKARKEKAVARPKARRTAATQEDEGLVRSFFRWLLG